ncbi:MAG: hypothetical protein V5783_09270 [Pontiella sp.]
MIDIPVAGRNLKPINKQVYFNKRDTHAANSAVRTEFREILKTDPFFRPYPQELFGADASAFADETAGTRGFTLNYEPLNGAAFIPPLLQNNRRLKTALQRKPSRSIENKVKKSRWTLTVPNFPLDLI